MECGMLYNQRLIHFLVDTVLFDIPLSVISHDHFSRVSKMLSGRQLVHQVVFISRNIFSSTQ